MPYFEWPVALFRMDYDLEPDQAYEADDANFMAIAFALLK